MNGYSKYLVCLRERMCKYQMQALRGAGRRTVGGRRSHCVGAVTRSHIGIVGSIAMWQCQKLLNDARHLTVIPTEWRRIRQVSVSFKLIQMNKDRSCTVEQFCLLYISLTVTCHRGIILLRKVKLRNISFPSFGTTVHLVLRSEYSESQLKLSEVK